MVSPYQEHMYQTRRIDLLRDIQHERLVKVALSIRSVCSAWSLGALRARLRGWRWNAADVQCSPYCPETQLSG